MKITDIEIEKLRLELNEPFHVAFTTIEYSENLIIKIITDEGICGYGEASPIEMVTGENIDTAYSILKYFRGLLIGEDPLAIDRIHWIMDKSIQGNTSAKCAVDLALYDIMGKFANCPVYKLLGGYSNTIQNDTTLSLDIPEKMAEEATRRISEGFKIIKIKAGINVDSDIEAVRRIRASVGPDIKLRVDANQGYNIPSALKALHAFSIAQVESVEQCLPHWDWEGASTLKAANIPGLALMLDESIHTPQDAAKSVRMKAADIFNIKLMKCGGLYRANQIYSIAEASGLSCIVGCMMESRLANAAGLSFAASKRFIFDADCDSYTIYNDNSDVPKGGFSSQEDKVILSERAGLGVEVNF